MPVCVDSCVCVRQGSLLCVGIINKHEPFAYLYLSVAVKH